MRPGYGYAPYDYTQTHAPAQAPFFIPRGNHGAVGVRPPVIPQQMPGAGVGMGGFGEDLDSWVNQLRQPGAFDWGKAMGWLAIGVGVFLLWRVIKQVFGGGRR